MFKIPVSTKDLGILIAESIEPVLDYETKQPKVNDDGMTQYRINNRYMETPTSKPEDFPVKIWLPKQPELTPYTQVVYEGLVAVYWQNGARSGVSFSADKVAKVRRDG